MTETPASEAERGDAITAETAMELGYIRDAIHSDGPEADAIREALGLRWERMQRWNDEGEPVTLCRRAMGEWKGVQP